MQYVVTQTYDWRVALFFLLETNGSTESGK